MVIQSEQDRVKHLLSQALPLLCKGGLTYSSEFCIEALIGITLDKDDVFIVSINETVRQDDEECDGEASIDISVTSASEERHVGSEQKNTRKRKHSRNSSQSSASQDDIDELFDSVAAKRNKSDTILLHNDSFDSANDDTPQEHSKPNNNATNTSDHSHNNIIIKTESNDEDAALVLGAFRDVSDEGFDLAGYHAQATTQFIAPSSRDSIDPSYLASAFKANSLASLSGTSSSTQVPIATSNQPQDPTAASTDDKMRELLKETLNASDFVGETAEGLWRCCICQKISRCKSNARKHVRVVHLKIRNSFCAYCNKGFGQTSNRKAHELTCSYKYPTIDSTEIQAVFPERQFIDYFPNTPAATGRLLKGEDVT